MGGGPTPVFGVNEQQLIKQSIKAAHLVPADGMGMRKTHREVASYKALVLNRFVLQHHYHQGAVDRQTSVAYMYQEGLEAEMERHYKLDVGTTLGSEVHMRGLGPKA